MRCILYADSSVQSRTLVGRQFVETTLGSETNLRPERGSDVLFHEERRLNFAVKAGFLLQDPLGFGRIVQKMRL